MKNKLFAPRWKEGIRPPGDDQQPAPPPVTEEPPLHSFCDLVLTGGVASGVVYPWAIVELARKFRFRNIGGTSVGAIAAALAAAAEYGRCNGSQRPFETLRRTPATLARKMEDGHTRMLSLFQSNPRGKRLLALWGRVADGGHSRPDESAGWAPTGGFWRLLRHAATVYWLPITLGLAAGVLLGFVLVEWVHQPGSTRWMPAVLVCPPLALLCGAASWACALWSDVRRGIVANNFGLCKGAASDEARRGGQPAGLTDWLHMGIQRSAGLKRTDPPLTFRDLWNAPQYPGAERRRCQESDPPACRSINLQMITTNVTHGRPYGLPLRDRTSRLFFRPEELAGYFPEEVIKAMKDVSLPYAPDPDSEFDPPADEATAKGLLCLPEADLPVVVAARLSLSYPVLFSAVPLWAIDYEAPRGHRTLRRCLFTDGGVSSNFPIHLFDAALPRWPTFGFWLDRRTPYRYREEKGEVWLPKFNGQGRGDAWFRFDDESWPVEPNPPHATESWPIAAHSEPPGTGHRADLSKLAGFFVATLESAKDWRDRTGFRLPHVRNRVIRLMLLPREGGIHIGMPGWQILEMARRYGTPAGQKFVQYFAPRKSVPAPAWDEQRWIRFNLLVNGLREQLRGLATAARWSTGTRPMDEEIRRSTCEDLVRGQQVGVASRSRGERQAVADGLIETLEKMEALEAMLGASTPFEIRPPNPELRLTPPL